MKPYHDMVASVLDPTLWRTVAELVALIGCDKITPPEVAAGLAILETNGRAEKQILNHVAYWRAK